MGETLVRLGNAQEIVLNRLTSAGVFKTKSEAIRAGIMGLDKEYREFSEIKPVEDILAIKKMEKISKEIKQGKRKVFTMAEVKKKYGFKWFFLFLIDFADAWDKYYSKLDNSEKKKILKKIEKLTELDSTRHMKYGLPYFVLETGQYRICFEEENNCRTIIFVGNHKQYEKWFKTQ